MRKLVLFMHISLDGYAAGPKGEMEWIRISEEMFELAGRQTKAADLALYGRGTYELMQKYWPTAAEQANPTQHDIEHSTWYNAVSKVVVSKTMANAEITNTKIISNNVAAEIRKLKEEKATGKEIIMFGSPSLAHTLMQENLIDDYWLLINPVILGKGISLFGQLNHRVNLRFLESSAFSSGVVCLHFEASRLK
jgi:dihydrofolate reductase